MHGPSRGVWAMPPSQEILVFRLSEIASGTFLGKCMYFSVYTGHLVGILSAVLHSGSAYYFDTSALNVLTSSQFQNNMLSQSVRQ